MMLSPIPRPSKRDLSRYAVSESELCGSPWSQPPVSRCSGRQATEWSTDASSAWFTLRLLEPCGSGPGTGDSSAVWFYRHPYIEAFQTGVSIERHLSRIFPAFPRSLARCYSRASSPQRTRTVRWGPRFCGLRASAFPGLLPQPGALGPHSGKCSSCLGSGAHSPPQRAPFALSGTPVLASLRARVSRGQSGQIQSGEKQWHSTQTTSL
jgi:hypothetical protein